MKKIIVTIPKNGEKWKVSFGSGFRLRNSAATIFSAIERRLQARVLKEKTAIVIKEGRDTSNESLNSTDARYLLYTLGCFLEDYLSEQMLDRIDKQYVK